MLRTEHVDSAKAIAWVWGARQRLAEGAVPLGVVGILLLATVLRFWHLEARSLWFDEAFSVYVAQRSPGDILRLLRAGDPHPPLHYLLLHVVIRLFGNGEVVVRAPSALASVGSVLLTFLLGRRLAGARVGLLASLLLALSPFHIASGREARMYPLLTLLALGSIYALWLALEEEKRRHWITYTVTTLLALGTHHFAFLLLPAQLLLVLAPGCSRRATRNWFLALVVVALLYVPYVPSLAKQLGVARNWPDIRPPFGVRAETDLLGLLSFGGGSFGMGDYFRRGFLQLDQRLPLLLPFILLPAMGIGALGGWRKRIFLLSYLIVPIALVSLISVRWNIFYERYFSFVLPPFAIMTAAGILGTGRNWPRTPWIATAALLLVVSAYTGPALADVYRGPWLHNWRGAAQHVAARACPSDLLLFVPSFARYPFDYYFRGPQSRVNLRGKRGPEGKLDLGNPAAAEVAGDEGTALIAVMAERHPHLWIIVTIPLGYENRKEVSRVLAPYFREVEGREFGWVFTSLWESRRHVGPH